MSTEETNMEIFYAVTDTTLTLWWDQPEGSPAGAKYRAILGDGTARECNRTHCLFDGLKPERNTRYGWR